MRVVQLANFYTPASGGLRTCLDQTGAGYQAAGHDRVLVVPGPKDSDVVTPTGRHIAIRSPLLPGTGGYRLLSSPRRVRALLDDLRPDVLEVSDKLIIGWLAPWARQRGIPLVLFSHERIDAMLRSRVPAWFPLRMAGRMANRRLSELVDEIVVTSAFSAAEFAHTAVPVVRIPLGVDLTTFRPADPPPAHTGPVKLVCVSRLSREKSPQQAVDALAVLLHLGVEAELLMIGDGPMRSGLQRRAAGLPAHFVGHIADRRTIADLVATSDVAVSPSPAETFGLATLEALACGVPVVVPADGAAGELLDGGGSGRITDGTAQGLAAGVGELLCIPAERRRADARAAAERFPWSATVAGLLATFASLTDRS